MNIGANTVAGAKHFARNEIVAPHHRFAAAQIKHRIAIFNALDDTIDDLANAVFKFFILTLALSLAHALHNHLLGRLRSNTAKLDRRQFINHLIAQRGIRIVALRNGQRDFRIIIFDQLDHRHHAQQFGLTGFRVNIDANIVFLPIARFRRFLDGISHSRQNNIHFNAFFACHRISDLQQFQLICTNSTGHFRLLKLAGVHLPRQLNPIFLWPLSGWPLIPPHRAPNVPRQYRQWQTPKFVALHSRQAPLATALRHP